ncbi:TetR/AcrR family transcriptional regulator [Citricoccus sp. SGAir0253]|uniref:TetR/AcrR family transcriptional regulator n=1 Tax=Citricoccus sp. SGAir0253 TaxID=2567881 RepID=UPI0010CCE7D4|nr:TetR/AcrR family transcriptional regulator [Citricoccus sp. SGAir0253]QCU77045.1 TetR/AcrR family transcriptional regulator [Citricoccus sp. SGAir0253]
MPKVVDHEERRRELVEATWGIIARHGMSGATMRQIAAEAGFANGALKPYFPTKAGLLEATYAFVFDRTNRRAEVATRGLTGLAALEAFCREVLPLDDERLDEARVVIPFWQEAAHDPRAAELNNASMAQWRVSMSAWMREAGAAGDLDPAVDVPAAADVLLNFLLGSQVSAVIDSTATTASGLERQLAAQLDRLRPR